MKHLIAKSGFKYTQAEEIDINERFFAAEIYLAETDSEKNYKIISLEEMNEMLKNK